MTDTTTLSYRKTEVKQVETKVPRYFVCDETTRGRLVGLLQKQDGLVDRDGRCPRDRLHDQEANTVERAIGQLTSAYEHADEIMAELGIVNDG